MAKIRNPLDREKAAMVKANAASAEERFAEHRKVCYDCRPGSDFPRRACERGWTMAKEVTRAANTLSVAQSGDSGDTGTVQESLW